MWSVGRCIGKGWKCAFAAALSATVLPIEGGLYNQRTGGEKSCE